MPDSITPPPPDDAASLLDSPKVAEPKPIDNEKVAKDLKSKADASKRNRRTYSSEWKDNVTLRLGKTGATVNTGGLGITQDSNRSEINPDWSLTKTKTANLYSQVPQVQMTHENKQYAAAIFPFAKALNYELSDKRMNIGVGMDEILNDVVNASGVGAIRVGLAARFETWLMPMKDSKIPQAPPMPAPPTGGSAPGIPPPSPAPSMGQPPGMPGMPPPAGPPMAGSPMPPPPPMGGVAGGAPPPVPPPPPPMVPTGRVVSDTFFGTRLSPTSLLWPAEFLGSCMDDADWVGYEGDETWSYGVNEWHLKDEDKEKVLTSSWHVPTQDDLRDSGDKGTLTDAQKVHFVRLFYWRHRVDPEEKHLTAIWELVFVEGLDKPVIHESWKGQQLVDVPGKPQRYIGACRFPLRFLTLTYITDNPIPPSDTAAGRAQVMDLRRSRAQMFQNRDRSIPIRWFDTNRVDPMVQEDLMRGTYQGWFPSNGDGTRAVGEIARASYPSEDLAFDQAAKADLMESWQIGPNQIGTQQTGKKTSAESNIVQQNFATRIGQERAKVASFFLGICDVLAGLMVLYSDFPILSDQERQAMESAWDQKHILHDLVLKIRPDSTITLEPQVRIQRLIQFLNFTAKSGFVNVKPIITEIAELTGLDPTEVIVDPQPKVEEPNFSYRVSGKDDLASPMVLAMMLEKKLAPSEQSIEKAKQLLQMAAMPPSPPGSTPPGAGGPGASGPPPPGPGAPQVPDDMPLMPKIAKRTRDGGPGA